MKRRRDLFSDQNVFCFTTEDLWQYKTMPLGRERRVRIFEHLQECKRCRLLYNDLREHRAREVIISGNDPGDVHRFPGQFQPRPQPPAPKHLAAGQIWTTTAKPRDHRGREVLSVPADSVLISWQGEGSKELDNLIRVIPISKDTEFAVQGEDVILREKSPLKYDILLTVWNESPMLAGNLDEYRGQISDTDLLTIQRVRESLLSETRRRRTYNADLKKWRRMEMERTAYLSAPVNASLSEEENKNAGDLLWPVRPIVVEFHTYQMAADTSGVGLEELHLTPLPVKTDLISASVLQKRNELLLRLKTHDEEPVTVFVAGKKRELVRQKKEFPWECRLGDVHAFPDQLEVKIVHRGEEHVFMIQPRRKER